MTEKQFYDWQTLGGTDDVMRFVNALESADILWCAIGDVAVNHWASEQMVTLDVDFVVAADSVEKAEKPLVDAGFTAERFDWSINLREPQRSAFNLRPRGRIGISLNAVSRRTYTVFCFASQASKTRWQARSEPGAIQPAVRANA